MLKADLLKLGLDEETASKVEAASLRELKDYTPKEEMKEYIPKARFNEVNDEKKALETVIEQRNAQLENLKNSTGDIEALKTQIADLQEGNKRAEEKHAAEIHELKVTSAVNTALSGAKAKNLIAVKALLKLEKATLDDDGKVIGLAEQIKELQGAEDSKFLFDAEKIPKLKGAKPAESGNEPPDTGVDISKMSYEEISAYMESNPDVKI